MEDRVRVEIAGLSSTASANGSYALILKEIDGPRRLPIAIGQFEAHAILVELDKMQPKRPLTHDLIKNLIESLGVALREVVITELRDGTFYARLIVDSAEIDSRPSDAIAIAVRCDVPIYVAEAVFDEAGFIPRKGGVTFSTDAAEEGENVEPEEEEEKEKPAPKAKKPPQKKISRKELLQQQLDDAIHNEEYEKAAKIRDELRRLADTE